MAFRTPTFNLQCNLWVAGQHLSLPPLHAPDVSGLPCTLFTSKIAMAIAGYFTFTQTYSLIAFPAHADLRGPHPATDGDLIELPQGTGRFYQIFQVEDIHKGYPNEYRLVVGKQQTDAPGGWRYPTP